MASLASPVDSVDDYEDKEYDPDGEEGTVVVATTTPAAPTPPPARAAATSRRKQARAREKGIFDEAGPSQRWARGEAAASGGETNEEPQVPPSLPKLKSKCWNDFKRIESSADEVIAEYFKSIFVWFAGRDSIFKSHFLPTPDEWDKLATVHSFFKTFYDVTLVFFGTKYPTSNLYFKCVFMVHTRLLEAHADGKKFMALMLGDMKEKFDKYWADYSVFLSCAVVLDPRYKLQFIGYCYHKLYDPIEAKRRVEEVKTTLVNLFNEYKGFAVSNPSSDRAGPSTSGGGADMFNDYESFTSTSQTHEEKSQLELYLEEPPRQLNEDLDILEYWSKSSMRYPELASMARDIFDVPVSSVASESAFSMSRKVITPNRSSLKPKTVEAIMCLQDWYRTKWQAAEKEREGQAQSENAPPKDDDQLSSYSE